LFCIEIRTVLEDIHCYLISVYPGKHSVRPAFFEKSSLDKFCLAGKLYSRDLGY
jgi:hypothetical protein